ncbi:hypothetical protein [Leifsonia sp. fls2-241-R2A-40a]|uniref:hypothetical protein n=1 Tax=Leifsonia sp. fls2-241-R2A-40a TaxID=3040290 RepID=UPI00254AE8C0|nr:hypothetical protein [Leifsonia sp. fls2-241-R2A-40a]
MDDSFRVGASEPTATPVATPIDEDTGRRTAAEKAVAGKRIGDELTKEQADAVKAYFDGDSVDYTTIDGKSLLVSRSQPLPENVKVDAGKKVAAAAQASAAANDPSNLAVEKAQQTIAYETGRPVVVVAHVYTANAAGDAYEWTWLSLALGGQHPFADAASAIAATQAAKPGVEIIVSQ